MYTTHNGATHLITHQNLSTAFAVDVRESWVAAHNREVREVLAAFNADRPIRVPVNFTGARSIYADENNLDYRVYYNDAEEMVRVQLESQKRAKELPLGDAILGELPEQWPVQIDLHPVMAPSCFGCEVSFRPDAVPAHLCQDLSKEDCRALAQPRAESGLRPHAEGLRRGMDALCGQQLAFMGRPVVRNKNSGPGCVGYFSLALDIRGPAIMADMYDDPEFVHEFLSRIAHWELELGRDWARLEGEPYWLDKPETKFSISDHGIDMLSVETYEIFLADLIHKLSAEFSRPPGTFLHHCGRGAHLFPAIRRHFGLTEIHALTYPTNDIAKVRRELGYEVAIVAILADQIVAAGPDAIWQTVREFLTPEVKGPGQLSIWVPGEARGIPIENYRALYEAVKAYGRY
jgi:uroporphyrinogen-III decarboxylase